MFPTPFDGEFLQSVKDFEGFAPRAQWDYKQNTNGWGTRAQYPGEVIGRDEANRRLQDELWKASQHVDRMGVPMSPGWRNALTDLTFNAGPGWQGAGLGHAVRSGDWDTARNLFSQYNKAGGQVSPALVRRRAADLGMVDGAPPPRPPADIPNQPQQPRTTMADQNPQQGALSSQRLSAWDSLGPALEKAALYLMGPQTAAHAADIDQREMERRKLQWTKTGSDMFGDEYGFVNPYTGQVFKPGQVVNSGSGVGPALAGTNNITSGADLRSRSQPFMDAMARGASADELRKLVPQEFASGVDAMTNYRELPSSLGPRSKLREPFMFMAHAIDPTFDDNAEGQRSQYYKTYGSPASPIAAGNRAYDHLATLSDKAVALQPHATDTGVTPLDYIGNHLHALSSEVSGMHGDVDLAGQELSKEMEKLFSGRNGGGVKEREEVQRLFSGVQSPTQLRHAIETAQQMIAGQLDEYRKQRDSVFLGADPKHLEQKLPIVTASDRLATINKNLETLRGGPKQPQQQQAPRGPVSPGRYIWTPEGLKPAP